MQCLLLNQSLPSLLLLLLLLPAVAPAPAKFAAAAGVQRSNQSMQHHDSKPSSLHQLLLRSL
jgi:hypothetical protein